MAQRGAPTKLTAEKMATIVTALKAGNYLETAASFVGVPKQTLFNWLRRGARLRDEIESGTLLDLSEKEKLYLEFFDSVSRARAEGEMRLVKTLHDAGKDDWRAAAWRLERLAPQRYGRIEFIVDRQGDAEAEQEVTEQRKRMLVMRLMSMAQRTDLLNSGDLDE